MALPLIPLAILGAGGFMLWRGLVPRASFAVAPIVRSERLQGGQLALQSTRFGGLIRAAQARGGLAAKGPAFGSPRGWAFQAVERKTDGEDQLLFAAPNGTPNFLVRGGFYTFYDKFMSVLGRPETDEYRVRDPNYRGMGGRILEIVRQDFQNGRMDWNPESGSVHVFDRSKRIGGWRRRRTSSYPWWDRRSGFSKGTMKLLIDLETFVAVGIGTTICVGGSIVTAGAAAVPLCQLGAKVSALTCTGTDKLHQAGEWLTEDFPPSSKLDYPDEGYITDRREVCNVVHTVDSVANSSGGDAAAGALAGLAQFGIVARL